MTSLDRPRYMLAWVVRSAMLIQLHNLRGPTLPAYKPDEMPPDAGLTSESLASEDKATSAFIATGQIVRICVVFPFRHRSRMPLRNFDKTACLACKHGRRLLLDVYDPFSDADNDCPTWPNNDTSAEPHPAPMSLSLRCLQSKLPALSSPAPKERLPGEVSAKGNPSMGTWQTTSKRIT